MDTAKEKIKHIPVFFATDEKYAPLAATSMASILFNTDSFIDFYILDCNLGAKTRKKFEMLHEKFSNFSVEFIPVASDERFAHIELRNYLTTACFARLLIPDVKPDLGKVIYLDCDTIVLQDIAQLYDQELDGYAIGAVPDPNVYNVPEKRLQLHTGALLSDTHFYFNSGILLIDCDVWRKNDMLPKLMAAERVTAPTRYYNDQDVLNKAFDSNYKQLDVRFNVKSNLITFCPQEHVVVRHFTGFMKPWVRMGFRQVNAKDFWFYCQMTVFFAETLVAGIAEVKSVNVLNAG
ncbi:MAG: glycosyltransferase family 8 protein [Alphaproteobacteria bacterium]|nr:glycosyltransferase family 8 protein [Alphaproteobacteria bacterium]